MISKSIKYAIKNSVFYKNKLYGFQRNKFEDFPFTTKQELLEDQLLNPPFGSNLCVNPNKIARIHKTSGTTNAPLMLALTHKDIQNTVKVGSECFRLAGLKESDIVVHCLNYNMWAGGYTDHQSLEVTGAAVIPFGVGNTKNLIKTILTLKPTAIHCTPSYLQKIELILYQEFKLTPSELGIKLGLFGGEGGLQNPLFRQRIEKSWKLDAMNANYGLSDVLSIFGSECKLKSGLHFMGNEFLFPELIDISTKKNVTISDGACGELVLTNLYKEAQPLIRYKTNDIIQIISTERCACGNDGFRFNVVGRTDDMVVIKGVNVFLSAIENIILDVFSSCNGVYQICINEIDPIDQIVLRIEINSNMKGIRELTNTLKNKVKEEIFINPEVILVKEGELPRVDGKMKKILRIL